MRMRKKPNLVPRMERCARFLIQAPEEQRGHWRELKPDAEQIWLELGCGKGRFTAETAAQNPNVLYLAVERVPDAMIVAMERCAQRSLTNVFFVDGDAARLREYFAPVYQLLRPLALQPPRPAAADPPELFGPIPRGALYRRTDPL